MDLALLVPVFGILVVLVPVAGLNAVVIAREFKGVGEGRSLELELRVRDLTDQVEALTSEVHELRSVQSFDRELLESTESDPRTL